MHGVTSNCFYLSSSRSLFPSICLSFDVLASSNLIPPPISSLASLMSRLALFSVFTLAKSTCYHPREGRSVLDRPKGGSPYIASSEQMTIAIPPTKRVALVSMTPLVRMSDFGMRESSLVHLNPLRSENIIYSLSARAKRYERKRWIEKFTRKRR